MILQEEMFEDVIDTAIENLFINAINAKWDSISNFNSILNTLKSEQYEEFIPVVESILQDEHNHIGKLQHVVDSLSGQSVEIEQGEQEASDILIDTQQEKEMTESLIKESFEQDVYGWLNNHWGTEDCQVKFKQYIDKIKSSAYNTTQLTTDINRAIKRYSKDNNIKPQKIMSSLQESLRNQDNIERNKKLVKKDITTESLSEDVDENASKFYVSYYEEAPAYHPEEGGYYVATCALIDYEEFNTLDEAKARIAEMADEDTVEKITDEFYLDRSKYIGGDRFYIIETELGSEEKGDEIYQ